MSEYRDYMATVFTAGEDLSAYQYHFIALDDGKRAASGREAMGVVQNKPKSGEAGTLIFMGEAKVKAGGTVAIGKITCSASGTAIAAASGYNHNGYALEAAASGDVFRALLNVAPGTYQVSSL